MKESLVRVGDVQHLAIDHRPVHAATKKDPRDRRGDAEVDRAPQECAREEVPVRRDLRRMAKHDLRPCSVSNLLLDQLEECRLIAEVGQFTQRRARRRTGAMRSAPPFAWASRFFQSAMRSASGRFAASLHRPKRSLGKSERLFGNGRHFTGGLRLRSTVHLVAPRFDVVFRDRQRFAGGALGELGRRAGLLDAGL